DGGVRADAERQRYDRDHRHNGRRPKGAKRETKILHAASAATIPHNYGAIKRCGSSSEDTPHGRGRVSARACHAARRTIALVETLPRI
ncbi:MAG: hypothetical protein ACRD3J_27890, partial [Thermoanaerobaculia bacterium]